MDDKEGQYANGCGSAPQPAAKKRYVRHISGRGEKWEVLDKAPNIGNWHVTEREWCVRAKHNPLGWHILPSSEYELVHPVKCWVDVTKDCFLDLDGDLFHGGKLLTQDEWPIAGYRIRNVEIDELKSWIFGNCVSVKRNVLIVEQEQEVPDGV